MSWKTYLICFLISAAVCLTLAQFQDVPGYMDAEYYYSMGYRIVTENTISEPFIWNYLAENSEIPHPGFSYWMPLPALLGALSMWLSRTYSFAGARIGSLILACLVPILTIKLTFHLAEKRSAAILAGLLAIFPAFYNIFWGTTDSFSTTMVLGAGFIIIALQGRKSSFWYAILGLIAGLMHLTRADGLIWAAAGLLVAWITGQRKVKDMGAVMLGYLVVMGPWFTRNLLISGELLPGGTSRMFWLREYNDLFNYRTEQLNYQYWVSQGFTKILGNIVRAGLENFKTLIFVQGQLILFPFMVLGFVKLGRKTIVQVTLLILAVIYFVMSAVFPFAGSRGGYLHSGAAIQPLLWALGSIGVIEVIHFGAKRRGWTVLKAEKVFGVSLVMVMALASVFIFWERVIGETAADPIWDNSYRAAQQINQSLSSYSEHDLVMINNPPGFYAATQRSSVVVPNGPINDLLLAANELGVKYIIIDHNHPEALAKLYQYPDVEERLIFLETTAGARLFQVPGQ